MNRKNVIIWSLFASCIAFLFLISLDYNGGEFYCFQIRDLNRAFEIIRGQAIFFGPETSGGGHLYGGFYYYLLAVPLRLGLGWQGTWYFMLFLASVATGLLFVFIKNFSGTRAALLLFVYLSVSNILVVALKMFMNPSFSIIFIVLAIMGMLYTFTADRKHNLRIWWLTCLTLGFGIQLHFTQSYFLVAAFILQLFAKRWLGIQALSRRDFVLGLSGFLIPIVPYLIWLIGQRFSFPLGQAAPQFIGQSQHTLDYLFNLGIKSLNDLNANRLIMALLPFIVGIFLFKLFHRFADSRIIAVTQERIRASKVMFVCAFVSVVPGLPFLSLNFTRYLIVGYFCAGVFLATLYAAYFPQGCLKFKWKAFRSLDVDVTVLCIALLLSLGTQFQKNLQDELSSSEHATFKEFQLISQAIYDQTHWSYAEAEKRIFYLNIYNELSPKFIYNSVVEEIPQKPLRSSSPPSGFFAGIIVSKVTHPIDAKRWLLRQHLEESVAKGIREGSIILEEPQLYGNRVIVIPYNIQPFSGLPFAFHNMQESYQINADVLPSLGSQSLLAEFNLCPNKEPFGVIKMEVGGANLSDPNSEQEIRITGETISKVSEMIIPNCTVGLLRPYIRFICQNEVTTMQLASAIGFYKLSKYWHFNSTQLAPFHMRIRPNCSSKIKSIAMGFEEISFVSQLTYTRLKGDSRLNNVN